MAVHQIKTIDGYVKYLQKTPTEVEALFRDLLIGVTSFFRDSQSFKVLEEQVIPKLFAAGSKSASSQEPAGATLRVWSPGCATGRRSTRSGFLPSSSSSTVRKSIPGRGSASRSRAGALSGWAAERGRVGSGTRQPFLDRAAGQPVDRGIPESACRDRRRSECDQATC